MSKLTPLLEAWDEAHRELDIALSGTPDTDLWKRPHPCLLSIGELAGHVAYWQAVWTGGGGNDRPDLATLPIQSPLVDHAFRYYTTNVDAPAARDITADQARREVLRVHEAAKALTLGKERDEAYPGQWGTWGNFVQYQAFHVAYHAGQVYSVRHLLGHETEDN